jgi:ribosomal RNA-processing protein 1
MSSSSSSSSETETDLYTDEVKFAKLLVHPDKAVRDDTLLSLQRYLQSVTSFEAFSMLKLWKALYYCLWLADKAPIQQELIGRIASLTTVFASVDVSVLFLQQFFRILFREWSSLDQYRVEKFYSLIRSMLNKMLAMIVDSRFSAELMDRLLQLLYCEALVKRPNGIRFHISDIFIEELYKATEEGGDIRTTAFVALLQPFLRIVSNVAEQGVFGDRVYKQVFTKFLAEYSVESYHKRKSSLGDGDAAAASQELAPQELSHRVFPRVQSRYLQKIVFDLASSEGTAESCRKKLYSLHKQLSATTGCDFVGEDYDVHALEKEDEEALERITVDCKACDKDGKVDDDDDDATALQSSSSSSKVSRKSKKLKRSADTNEDSARTTAVTSADSITPKIVKVIDVPSSQRPNKRIAEMLEQGLVTKKVHVVAATKADTIEGSTGLDNSSVVQQSSKEIVPDREAAFIASKVFAGRREGYKFQRVRTIHPLQSLLYHYHHHHHHHHHA